MRIADNSNFTTDLADLLNRHGIDARVRVPDVQLATHIAVSLDNLKYTLDESDMFWNCPLMEDSHD